MLVVAGVWVAALTGREPQPAAGLIGFVQVAVTTAPFVAMFWLAAAGFGAMACGVLRIGETCDAPVVVRLAIGVAIELAIDWLLLLTGQMNWVTAALVCVLGAACLVPNLVRSKHLSASGARVPFPSWPWPVLLSAAPVGVLLFAASCPPGTLWSVEAFGYDVLSYHLQLPREWLQLGRMTGLHHNVYGYLPNLVEAGYAQLWALTNGQAAGVYTAQWLHATTTVLAAACAGVIARRAIGTDAGFVAAALFLALPWTLITGSMAYDEMFTLALGGAAIALAFNSDRPAWRDAAAAGFLAGAATLAKLPAGPMIAIPVGVAVVMCARRGGGAASEGDAYAEDRKSIAKPQATTGGDGAERAGREGPSLARGVAFGAIAALAGALTLAPYFVRNAAWTGNPVFPFAASSLGRGHWSPWQVKRWNNAHRAEGSWPHRISELGRRWVFNTGFGAVGDLRGAGSRATQRAEAAKFSTEWGVPVFWGVAAIGAVALLAARRTRALAVFMVISLIVQCGFWLCATHLQSRFLAATLLPGCVLAAGLLAPPMLRVAKAYAWLGVSALLVVCVGALSVAELGRQKFADFIPTGFLPGLLRDTAQLRRADTNDFFYHPINALPRDSKVLLVGDVMRLLYLQPQLEYATAFDLNPLATRIADEHGQSAGVTESLKRDGFTHVWVNWSELARIDASFGVEADAKPGRVAEIARNAGWRVVYDQPGVTLFELR